MNRNSNEINGNEARIRRQRRFHRYLGLTASMFLLLFIGTGILLQHQQDLGFDQRFVTSTVLLDLYGIQAPSSYQACRTRHVQVTRLGETLFMQSRQSSTPPQRLTRTATVLVGCVENNGVVVLATDHVLVFYTGQGEFIEAVTLTDSPLRIGHAAGLKNWLVFETATGTFSTDENALLINPMPGQPNAIDWSQEAELEPFQLDELHRQYLNRILSWQQVLRDVHAGQILGVWGRFLVDLVALGILILACSGIALWWKGSNQ